MSSCPRLAREQHKSILECPLNIIEPTYVLAQCNPCQQRISLAVSLEKAKPQHNDRFILIMGNGGYIWNDTLIGPGNLLGLLICAHFSGLKISCNLKRLCFLSSVHFLGSFPSSSLGYLELNWFMACRFR